MIIGLFVDEILLEAEKHKERDQPCKIVGMVNEELFSAEQEKNSKFIRQ